MPTFLLLTFWTIILSLPPSPLEAGLATAPQSHSLEREALEAFNHGYYDRVLKLWHSLPSEPAPSNPLIHLAFQSFLKLGRPEEAVPLYHRLVAPNQPDDPALLRPLALSFLSSHVRDPQEY